MVILGWNTAPTFFSRFLSLTMKLSLGISSSFKYPVYFLWQSYQAIGPKTTSELRPFFCLAYSNVSIWFRKHLSVMSDGFSSSWPLLMQFLTSYSINSNHTVLKAGLNMSYTHCSFRFCSMILEGLKWFSQGSMGLF